MIEEYFAKIQWQYAQSTSKLTEKEQRYIEELIHSHDPKYIQQGLSLLYGIDSSLPCRYLQLHNGQIDLINDFAESRLSFPSELSTILTANFLELFQKDPLWLPLWKLGAFDHMRKCFLHRQHWSEMQKNDQHWILDQVTQMELIPNGEFWMGALPEDKEAQPYEHPRHRVRISQDFWVSKFPVTAAWWHEVIGQNTCQYGNFHPVIEVTWWDAVHFCNELSRQQGLQEVYPFLEKYQFGDNHHSDYLQWLLERAAMEPKANGYRLLTEAEWEYAARGGEEHLYPGSNDWEEIALQLDLGPGGMVGSRKANAFGLCDMAGMVNEWLWDVFDEKSYAQRKEFSIDPVGRPQKESRYRVARGGDFHYGPSHFRCSHRNHFGVSYHFANCGFRIARNCEK